MKTSLLTLLLGLLTVAPACAQKSANAEETAGASADTKPQIAQSVDRQEDPIRAEIVDGRVRLTAKTNELYWPTPTHFVQGLEGRCVGLFVGDIGQDTCPFLCMLMDDGGVEIISYQSLGTTPDFYDSFPEYTSSGRLPGMKDITRFREGPVINEYGFAEYNAIFAIDRQGREHEIEPCLIPGHAVYHYNGDEEYKLLIYPDWTFELTVGMIENTPNYTYIGRLSPIKMDYANGVFDYSYSILARYDYSNVSDQDEDVSTNAKPLPSPENGSFRLTEKNDGKAYELTILSGKTQRFVSKPNRPARYIIPRRETDEDPM